MSTENDAPTTTEPPTVVRRLWGATEPGRRGPKPALSTEKIVRAAMDLADAEGLTAVSMARIAKSLDCTPMAIYRHVTGKEELLVLLTDAPVGGIPDIPADAGWRAGLRIWTRAQVDVLVSRSWLLDLVVSATPPGPNRVRWLDLAFRILEPVTLPPDEKLAVIGLLAQHSLGAARIRVDSARTAADAVRRAAGLPDDTPAADLDPAALRAADPYADFHAALLRYADPADYPHLFAAFDGYTGPTGPTGPTDAEAPDEDIDFAIEIVLDGVEAYFRRRGAIA